MPAVEAGLPVHWVLHSFGSPNAALSAEPRDSLTSGESETQLPCVPILALDGERPLEARAMLAHSSSGARTATGPLRFEAA